MISKIGKMLIAHVRNNSNTYFMLLLVFVAGVSAGAFTVNGLSRMQMDELSNYFHGFLHLLENQRIDNSEILKIALLDNAKIIAVLWTLGVTIIGIPFIFLIVGIRGFITGFCSGLVIKTIGMNGLIFSALALLPKEIIIVPCILALGVNGINFSLNIIKSKSVKHISKESLKKSFAAYCFVTAFYSCFILVGILVDAYITPVFIRMIAHVIIN